MAIVALVAQVLPLLAYCHLLWINHQAMVDEAVVLAPLTSHGDHFGVMERSQVGHPTAPITSTIIITIIVKYFELYMTQLLLLGKFEYTGGPIFKVVIEC